MEVLRSKVIQMASLNNLENSDEDYFISRRSTIQHKFANENVHNAVIDGVNSSNRYTNLEYYLNI